MKRSITLSIAITGLLGGYAHAAPAAQLESGVESQAHVEKASVVSKGGGKCASGKCGTEKIYSKASVIKNPQDQLVYARDGKCGLSGNGRNVPENNRSKLAEGICGT